jgi:hypothetical protein
MSAVASSVTFSLKSALRAVLVPCMVAFAALSLSGCVVEERGYARHEPPCPGGRWIEGHYGPYGAWHRGHWRCPGVVEVVEVR